MPAKHSASADAELYTSCAAQSSLPGSAAAASSSTPASCGSCSSPAFSESADESEPESDCDSASDSEPETEAPLPSCVQPYIHQRRRTCHGDTCRLQCPDMASYISGAPNSWFQNCLALGTFCCTCPVQDLMLRADDYVESCKSMKETL